MTEKEKMLAGLMYDPMDRELNEMRTKARILFQKINGLGEESKKERDQLFYELVGKAGDKLWIEPPFYCDYGSNITTGDRVFMNFNCCILDVCQVSIGSDVMIGPNVQIYTATHPLEAKARNSGKEFAKPISIASGVWIGGGAIICPGVKIGENAVIGAGSVVTKNIPNDVFAAGNPAKVIRKIENE